ncbi:hypothetical protein Tco_0319145 [Tanacetum coccineum]
MLANDEEIARKVQEKRLAEEEATKVSLTNEYDFIQARINADKILAEELQKEEREKFTIDKEKKFLHRYHCCHQRKFLLNKRSEAIRITPTRNKMRNIMMTYLKHVVERALCVKDQKTFEVISGLHKVSSQMGNYLLVYRGEKQYSEITPEDIKLILWGDLKIILESSTEENDQELKDRTVIYMLVERRYPLSKELLQQMLDLGLEVEEESTAILQLFYQNYKAKLVGCAVLLRRPVVIKDGYLKMSTLSKRSRSRFDRVFGYILQEFMKSKLKKHEVKQVQQSCLGELVGK